MPSSSLHYTNIVERLRGWLQLFQVIDNLQNFATIESPFTIWLSKENFRFINQTKEPKTQKTSLSTKRSLSPNTVLMLLQLCKLRGLTLRRPSQDYQIRWKKVISFHTQTIECVIFPEEKWEYLTLFLAAYLAPTIMNKPVFLSPEYQDIEQSYTHCLIAIKATPIFLLFISKTNISCSFPLMEKV